MITGIGHLVFGNTILVELATCGNTEWQHAKYNMQQMWQLASTNGNTHREYANKVYTRKGIGTRNKVRTWNVTEFTHTPRIHGKQCCTRKSTRAHICAVSIYGNLQSVHSKIATCNL